MNKKLLIMLALAGALASSAFGADTDPSIGQPGDYGYQGLEGVYLPTDTRLAGMGGAGLALNGYASSFLNNPASLARGGFRLQVPTIGVTVFNLKKIKDSDFLDEVKDRDWVGTVDELLGTLTYGLNEVERLDAGVNLQIGHLGLSVTTTQSMFGTLENSSYVDGKYLVQDTTAATVGYGVRLPILGNIVSLDLGANVQFVYQAYTAAMDKDLVDKFVDDPDSANVALAAGYAMPFTFGANVNLPLGFRVGSVLRNVNGKFKFHVFDAYSDWNFNDSLKDDAFTYNDGIRWDFGGAWQPEWGGVLAILKPAVTLDILDVTDVGGDKDIYRHLYAGAQMTVFHTLDLRLGLSQGYQTVGVGLNLFAVQVDVSYWRKEYGEHFLDKSIDALTVSFTLGTK